MQIDLLAHLLEYLYAKYAILDGQHCTSFTIPTSSCAHKRARMEGTETTRYN